MNKKHILYSFRRCPYAMRARMAMVRAGVAFDIVEVDLKNKPAAMLEISPKGTVPVLQTNEGQVIDESLDIVGWALPQEWAAVDKGLIAENDGSFKRALDRYKYPSRYPDEDCFDARDKGEVFLQKLDGSVKANAQTLIDICLFPFVRQFANVDRNWFDDLQYENLHEWLDFNVKSDLFMMVMDKGFRGI